MSRYQLKKPFKTRFLNIIRRLFMIRPIESWLANKMAGAHNAFIEKLLPPNYLYKTGNYRKVNREGINYHLDISNVVDHFIYFSLSDVDFSSVENSIKNSKVILDIGGNVGSKAMYFSKLNPSARIFSFEPHPETFKKALKNLELNNFNNIEFLNFGLGNKKETLKLYEVNKNNPGMNRIMEENMDFPFHHIEIDLIDEVLAKLNIEDLDFIKIDVEGFEFSVLEGGKQYIEKYLPVIFLELDDNNLRDNKKSASLLVKLLKEYGYRRFINAQTEHEVSPADDFTNCHFDLIAKV